MAHVLSVNYSRKTEDLRSENTKPKQLVKTMEEHQELLRKHKKTNEEFKGDGGSDNEMELLRAELDKQVEASNNDKEIIKNL